MYYNTFQRIGFPPKSNFAEAQYTSEFMGPSVFQQAEGTDFSCVSRIVGKEVTVVNEPKFTQNPNS